jgi:hypothetical protein
MVRFEVHPVQRSTASSVTVEAEVVDEREVRNSGGQGEVRPVIVTRLRLGGREWPIEVTLTRRDEMGFRLLLGRQAVRGRAVVDPGAAFLCGDDPHAPAPAWVEVRDAGVPGRRRGRAGTRSGQGGEDE